MLSATDSCSLIVGMLRRRLGGLPSTVKVLKLPLRAHCSPTSLLAIMLSIDLTGMLSKLTNTSGLPSEEGTFEAVTNGRTSCEDLIQQAFRRDALSAPSPCKRAVGKPMLPSVDVTSLLPS